MKNKTWRENVDNPAVYLLLCHHQVSYSSTCSALESKFQFPTFLRTISNDKHQSKAIAKLVLHFGWTWVGTIAANDDYGKYGIKDFKEQVEEAGVCISFSETLPKVNTVPHTTFT